MDAKVNSVRACADTGKVQKSDGTCILPAATSPTRASLLATLYGPCPAGNYFIDKSGSCVTAVSIASRICGPNKMLSFNSLGIASCIDNPKYSCNCPANQVVPYNMSGHGVSTNHAPPVATNVCGKVAYKTSSPDCSQGYKTSFMCTPEGVENDGA